MYQLEVADLSKSFGPRRIFEKVSFSLNTGQGLAITGPNGSGKSTMIHILTGLGRASSGVVRYTHDSNMLSFEEYRNRMSVVTPYHEFYDAMTALENLDFYTRLAGLEVTGQEMMESLRTFGLGERGRDRVAAYSSGMKQRLKYALALLRRPEILLLDEPTAYLDQSGKKGIFDFLDSVKSRALIIIATNEKEEAGFADHVCQLGG